MFPISFQAFPEKLTLLINHESRGVNLVSRCTRAGGSWSTTDVLIRGGDDQESWIWNALADIEKSGVTDDKMLNERGDQAEQAPREMKGKTELELSRPRWVQKVPRPVHAIVLHKLEGSKKGMEYEVELVFDDRQ